jgi:hypothetical protein
MNAQTYDKVEFGDFQTPIWFAQKICHVLTRQTVEPHSILEPTCGRGNILYTALENFDSIKAGVGAEINLAHINSLKDQAFYKDYKNKIDILHTDFFHTQWEEILQTLPDPVLIIGNPPWVTNSALALLDSTNLPPKYNSRQNSGIEAMTGASNFDISEWMLLKMVGWIQDRKGILAMLCKTAVARKVLLHTWQTLSQTGSAQIYHFDTQTVFKAAVDACLFIYDTRNISVNKTCDIYDDISKTNPSQKIGFCNGQLIANIELYNRWQHLENQDEQSYRWRSGIKHDCAKVMELTRKNGAFTNKLGETYQLENTHLYPMLKSSDIASPKNTNPQRWMLVTQRSVDENTRTLQFSSPRTWNYLEDHAYLLDNRKSAIYRNRPRFSIFGVGDYSFSTWKVVISGLYKKLKFIVVGPVENKPVVLDDTCYFLSCKSEEEAVLMADLLRSKPAQQFYESFIFWDSKRPITAKILQKLNLLALAEELGQDQNLRKLQQNYATGQLEQLSLFENLKKSRGFLSGIDTSIRREEDRV